MERLDSTSNEKIKFAAKIASSARFRRENKMFFLEGLRLCKDAAITGVEICYAFFSEKAFEKFPEAANCISSVSEAAFIVSSKVEEKLSQTESSQGFFCLCRMPDKQVKINPEGKYVALDNVQDPSNLGAICRTAEALGIDGVFVYSGCDIYNPKAQRAAMGSLLRIPVLECESLCDTLWYCDFEGMSIYATTPDAKAQSIVDADMTGGVVVVIGNEAKGVSDEVLGSCDSAITIPMAGKAESLNASMAAAIVMWEMMSRGDPNV